MNTIQPVILCGGSGTRLWPLSRSGFPKQFLCLTGKESLFQLAAQRLDQLAAADITVSPPLIVTGEDHRFLCLEQLREINIAPEAELLEPAGRNTAPALTLAALAALESGQDPILVVTPSDQTIGDATAFTVAMQHAIRDAASGSIVILASPRMPPKPATVTFRLNPAHNRCRRFGVLSKNRTAPRPNPIWMPGAITGMPACSFSRLRSGFRRWGISVLIFSKPPGTLGPCAVRIRILCVRARRNSLPSPRNRSTTP